MSDTFFSLEKDRRFKEQFISDISDEQIMNEVIRELTAIRETNKVKSEEVLCWAKRLEVL